MIKKKKALSMLVKISHKKMFGLKMFLKIIRCESDPLFHNFLKKNNCALLNCVLLPGLKLFSDTLLRNIKTLLIQP